VVSPYSVAISICLSASSTSIVGNDNMGRGSNRSSTYHVYSCNHLTLYCILFPFNYGYINKTQLEEIITCEAYNNSNVFVNMQFFLNG